MAVKTKKAGPVKRAVRAFVTFKWAYLLFAVMFIAAGAGFIAHPAEATQGVCVGVGAIAAVFALLALCITMSGKKRGFRFWAKTVTTALGLVMGIVVIILSATGNGDEVFRVLILIMAVYMIVDGSFKLQTAILSRRYQFWLWWVLLVLVVVAIGFGVFALYNGSEMGELISEIADTEVVDKDGSTVITEGNHTIPILVGIAFIIDGILNFLSIIFLYRIEHGQRDDVIRELEEEGRLAVIEDAEPSDDGARAIGDRDTPYLSE